MKRLRVYLSLYLGLVILSFWGMTETAYAYCPCPIPPFTYCQCCPSPCPVIDPILSVVTGVRMDISKVITGQYQCTESCQAAPSTFYDYVGYNNERIGLQGGLPVTDAFSQGFLLDPLLPGFHQPVLLKEFSLPAPQSGSQATSIPVISDAARSFLYLGSGTPTVTVANTYYVREQNAKINVALNAYSNATAARQQLPDIYREMESYQNRLSDIIKSANSGKGASEGNTLREMWRLNTDVKHALEKANVQTQNLMNSWAELTSFEKMTSSIAPQEQLDVAPILIPAFLTAAAAAYDQRNACTKACATLDQLLDDLHSLLNDIAKVHNARFTAAGFADAEEGAVSIINQHKRNFAQLLVAEAQLKNLLGTMFVDPDTAFQLYVDDLLKQSSVQDNVYDGTEYIDNFTHYQQSIDTSNAIHNRMQQLARPQGGAGNNFPIEQAYGQLRPEMKYCVGPSGSVFPGSNCTEYVIERQLQTLYSPYNRIIYPPSAVETLLAQNVQGVDDDLITGANLTMDDVTEVNSYLNYTQASASGSQYYALVYPTFDLNQIGYMTSNYPHLNMATIFYLESDKEERYLWYYRYGNDVNMVLQNYQGNNARYESISPPPAWVEMGKTPWWEGTGTITYNSAGDTAQLTGEEFLPTPRYIPPDAPDPSRFQRGSGAEGLLEYIQEMKKWFYAENIEIAGHYSGELQRDGIAAANNLGEYIQTEEGIGHLEYALLRKFYETIDQLEDELQKHPVSNGAFSDLAECGCNAERILNQKKLLEETAEQVVADFIAGSSSPQQKIPLLAAKAYSVGNIIIPTSFINVPSLSSVTASVQ